MWHWWTLSLSLLIFAGCGLSSRDSAPPTAHPAELTRLAESRVIPSATATRTPPPTFTPLPTATQSSSEEHAIIALDRDATPAATADPNWTPMPTSTPPSTSTPAPPIDSSPIFKIWDRPEIVEPGKITGFELIGRVGSPAVPNSPSDALVLPDGRVLVTDTALGAIIEFDQEGDFTRFWRPPDSQFVIDGAPIRLAYDPTGSVYVLHSGGNVRRFTLDGTLDPDWSIDWGFIGEGNPRYLGFPQGIAVDSAGAVYVGAVSNGPDYVFVRVTPAGEIDTYWETDDICIGAFTIDSTGVMYSKCGDAVYRLDIESAEGEIEPQLIWEYAKPADSLASIVALGIGPDGELGALISGGVTHQGQGSYVHHDWSVQIVDRTGRLVSSWSFPALADPGHVTDPSISFNEFGQVLVTDVARQRVVIYERDGTEAGEIGGDQPEAWTRVDRLAIDSQGYVYVLDMAQRRVTRLTPDGSVENVIPVPGETDFVITGRTSLLDETPELAIGPDRNLAVTIEGMPKLLYFSQSGDLLAEWSSGGQYGLAIDSAGFIYAVGNSGVHVLDPVAGTRISGVELPEGFESGGDIAIVEDRMFLTGAEEISGEESRSAIRRFGLNGVDLGGVVAFQVHQLAIEFPIRVAADEAGNVYTISWNLAASDPLTQPEYRGQPISTIYFSAFTPAGVLFGSGILGLPGNSFHDLVVSADGQRLYISDPVGRQVLIYERAP